MNMNITKTSHINTFSLHKYEFIKPCPNSVNKTKAVMTFPVCFQLFFRVQFNLWDIIQLRWQFMH